VTFTLEGFIISTLAPSPENDAQAYYSLSAIYIPFDSVGENPVIPAPLAVPATGRQAR
jgi:hypothetical protein